METKTEKYVKHFLKTNYLTMVAKKSVTKVESVKEFSTQEAGVMGMAEKIAVSLLDKNKDGSVKDDLLTMAMDFLKSRFAKK